RALSDGERGGTGKLVAVADDKIIERVSRIQLSRGGPIEAHLFGDALRGGGRSGRRVRRHGTETPVLALRRHGRILFGGHEADVVEIERLHVDRFLDEVAVLVANVLELGCGNTNVQGAAGGVAITRGFEPRLK